MEDTDRVKFEGMVDRLQAIRVLRIHLDARLKRLTPPSEEGRNIVELLRALDKEESAIRNSDTFNRNRDLSGL